MNLFKNIIAVIRGQFLIFPNLNIGLIRVFGKVNVRGSKKNLKIGKRVIFNGTTHIVMNHLCNDYINIGENVFIEHGCYLNAHEGQITIGKNTFLGVRVLIQGKGSVQIEENVMIGPDVKIFSSDHPTNPFNVNRNTLGEIKGAIKIKSNVWIGANTIILKNVTIAPNCVVLAGSTIKTNLIKSGLYGNPSNVAKLIREF
jgi:acetyltransferase-like isoleucine patch superfamily enzyme